MHKNISRILYVLLFTSTLYGCVSSYKSQLFAGEGGIEQARMNAITDFANTYKTPRSYLKERGGKPFEVFWVLEKKITPNVYVFGVSPEIDGNITLSIKDSLGKVPNSFFPNNFEVKEERLFLWKDSTKPLRKDVLEVVDKFGVLDSVDVKRELGMLPIDFEDTRVVTIDHSLKSVHYYICKNDIAKYKKVVTNKAIGFYEPPNLRCSPN